VAAATARTSFEPRSAAVTLLPAGILALAWFAAAISHPLATPTWALIAGIVLAPALGVAAVATGKRLPDAAKPATISIAALVAVLSLAAALSGDMVTALWGHVGVRTGLLAWSAAAVWFVAGTVAASGRTLRTMVATIAIGGAIASLFAAADAAGIMTRVARWSPEPSGFMSNSNALAQLLVLGLACAAAWIALSRSPGTKLAAQIALALNLAGLVLSQSRGAWIAAVLGGLVAWFLIARKPALPSRRIGIGVVTGLLAFIIAIGVLWWSGDGVAGLADGVTGDLNDLTTGRMAIWGGALEQLQASPALGEGPGLFSVIYEWSADPARLFGRDVIGTRCGHSLLFAIPAAGGIAGLAALLALAGTLASALSRVITRSKFNAGAVFTACGLGAWGVTQLVECADPLSMLSAALLTGTLLGASLRDTTPEQSTHRPAMLVATFVAGGMLAIALVAFAAPLISHEMAWLDKIESGTVTADALIEGYDETGDSVYATAALQSLLSQAANGAAVNVESTVARAREFATRALPDAERDADLAIQCVQAFEAQWGVAQDTEMLQKALGAGRMADPATDLFDIIDALRQTSP